MHNETYTYVNIYMYNAPNVRFLGVETIQYKVVTLHNTLAQSKLQECTKIALNLKAKQAVQERNI